MVSLLNRTPHFFVVTTDRLPRTACRTVRTPLADAAAARLDTRTPTCRTQHTVGTRQAHGRHTVGPAASGRARSMTLHIAKYPQYGTVRRASLGSPQHLHLRVGGVGRRF